MGEPQSTHHLTPNTKNNILSILNIIPNDSYKYNLLISKVYRGLAMIVDQGFTKQNHLLEKAEYHARSSKGRADSEKIVVEDNLYTCLQTIAKWKMAQNKVQEAQAHLHEMVTIDPYDSTGHSELAFFLMKLEDYQEASSYFIKAVQLGASCCWDECFLLCEMFTAS